LKRNTGSVKIGTMSQWKDLKRKDTRKRGTRAHPPRLLLDMRRVQSHPEEEDLPRYVNLRKWLKTDTKGFMARLSDLEKAWMAKLGALGRSIAEDKTGIVQDPRTESLQDELAKLLRECQESTP
jgi:hypothetical protein